VELTLTGKVALVTGASRGIGLAVARGFAAAGATVMLSARTAGDLETAAAAIPGASWYAADAGDPQQANACVTEAIRRYGQLDILVNNAGVNTHSGPLVDIDEPRADRAVQVNQHAVVRWTAAAWHASMREHGGAVVNITAIGGLAPFPGSGWYNGTKAAVIQLTRQLACELGPGVRVNAIAPGVVTTGMGQAMKAEYGPTGPAAPPPASAGPGREQRIPLRRLGTPEDIAAAALFLVSDAASWITGHTLVVDGGALATPTTGM
jgi:NAD(P)-dependent dehydrogenase (short-subunit alcohol dehydrogenase family)